jgi:hypothetical protein
MAEELGEEEFKEKLFSEPLGWHETFCLAVAQLPGDQRRRTLLERGYPEFALSCLNAAPPEEPWLQALVRFLSRYTQEGEEYESLSAVECADDCKDRVETLPFLRAMFDPAAREGRSLATAVELAEELASRSIPSAKGLLDAVFGESAACSLDSTERMAWIGGFFLDRNLVTNGDYDRMVPGHATLRD